VDRIAFSNLKRWPWLVLTPVIAFVLVGVFAPWIMPFDPAMQDYDATLRGISPQHWLGTDYLGRDLFSRIVAGARISLVAMSTVLVAALAIGVTNRRLIRICRMETC